jgi:ribulose-phosphate 3-epimerase
MQKKPYYLSASLICANMLNLEDELKKIELSGCDAIHFDVMDGVFVPRYGLYPEILELVKSVISIPVYVHMMTVEPEKYIQTFANAGADCIAVHAESCVHLHRTLKLIKSNGIKVGVALNIATPLSVLEYVLDEIDLIMLMAINPGIVGHKLIPNVFNKIRNLRDFLTLNNNDGIIIEIDGGVTFESAPKMLENGANMLVCGSSTIFKKDKPIIECVSALKGILSKRINDEL